MLALLVGTLSSVAQDTWTVAGNAVNGTAWDAGNSANDMTTTDGVNFTLTVEELTLEKATEYKYKVVRTTPGVRLILHRTRCLLSMRLVNIPLSILSMRKPKQ